MYEEVIIMKLVAAKCPSCGAGIKVDRSLKITKCEYCNSEIMVEEAVGNLLKVELKDTPTLDNLLKLGARYFDNREFEEAYKVYSKAEEINPDIPIVVLRRGLCRSIISDYNNFDVSSAINAMKTSYDLMKKMKMSKDEIDISINDTGTVLFLSFQYVLKVYKNNKLNKEQTKGYIDRLEECLKGYQYLDTIVDGNQEMQDKILNSMIIIIDTILGNYENSNYQLSSSYISELKSQKNEYTKRRKTVMEKPTYKTYEKVVDLDSKKNIIWDALCYLMIAFLFIMLLGSFFNKESFIVILLWLLSIVSFVPQIKRGLIKRFGSSTGKIVIAARILLIIGAFIYFASIPLLFEKTFTNEGVEVTFHSGNLTIKNGDKIITGTYEWDSKGNEYYIHCKDSENNKYEYRFKYNEDTGGSLCLLVGNECQTIYYPKIKTDETEAGKTSLQMTCIK